MIKHPLIYFTDMQQITTAQQNELSVKETWSKPEVTLMSIAEETLTPLKGRTGGDFSSQS